MLVVALVFGMILLRGHALVVVVVVALALASSHRGCDCCCRRSRCGCCRGWSQGVNVVGHVRVLPTKERLTLVLLLPKRKFVSL